MLFTSLSTALSAVILFTSSTNALPRPGKQPTTYTPAADLSKLAKLMPTSALPVPDGQLKYVVLGLGTQNYTCLSGSPDAAPGTTGALGKIYQEIIMQNAVLTSLQPHSMISAPNSTTTQWRSGRSAPSLHSLSH
jgi:hypothetical protein